ncbi:dTDP-4-dehydrorhamnose 3,5-epimerase family protein [Streptomyces sp. NPDC006512]|uniref:dTDP-4-dehydrorhamnose 3,5-epimerase family protein n=1 Tax=Streptomyces sp. NPDC006512 TaxID=3154307 RepID=UPI0033B9E21C
MRIEETPIPGAYVVTPEAIVDERGSFYEVMRTDEFERVTGERFVTRQINYSVSRKNTLRGIHSVTSPPGQTKFITCVRGIIRDFVVDLRIGSPTFGRWHSTVLDAASGTSVYVPEGVGHGFLALSEEACTSYAVDSTYVPGTQIDIDPLDPELAVPWGYTEPPLISDKDRAAPSLRKVRAAGLLIEWRDIRIPSSRARAS